MIKVHNKVKKKEQFHKNKQKVNADEILRIEYDLRSFYGGDDFINPKHPNSSDLTLSKSRSSSNAAMVNGSGGA